MRYRDDGQQKLSFTSTDTLGLAQFDQTLTVNIDTRRPTPKAPYAASARRGRTATLKVQGARHGPQRRHGEGDHQGQEPRRQGVKTLKLGAKPVNAAKALTAKFKVPLRWKAGPYRFFVYATDLAGNKQANIARNKLVVK